MICITDKSDSIIKKSSKCCDSFRRLGTANDVIHKFEERPLLVSDVPDKVSMIGVNAGSGSTGTNFLHNIILNRCKLRATHYNSPPARAINSNLRMCIAQSNASVNIDCESGNILKLIKENVIRLITKYEFASDTPVAQIFPDILKVIPDLITISTFREYNSFIHSRNKHRQNDDFLCSPELWEEGIVLHPFDIISCIRLRPAISQSVIYVRDYIRNANDTELARTNIQRAYGRMNTVNSLIAEKNSRFLPVCLNDYERNTSFVQVSETVQQHLIHAKESEYSVKTIENISTQVYTAHSPSLTTTFVSALMLAIGLLLLSLAMQCKRYYNLLRS